MKLNVISEFENFMRKVYPTVPEDSTQYRESRVVFVAGATSLYFHCTGAITNMTEADAMQELEDIRNQLTIEIAKQIIK